MVCIEKRQGALNSMQAVAGGRVHVRLEGGAHRFPILSGHRQGQLLLAPPYTAHQLLLIIFRYFGLLFLSQKQRCKRFGRTQLSCLPTQLIACLAYLSGRQLHNRPGPEGNSTLSSKPQRRLRLVVLVLSTMPHACTCLCIMRYVSHH